MTSSSPRGNRAGSQSGGRQSSSGGLAAVGQYR